MNFTITEDYKENFINSVIEANKELYQYLHYNLDEEDLEYSNTIGYGGDNSLNIDLYAEKIFIKHLKEFGNIYSEECGFLDFNKDFTIIIDPIDGSDNFYSNLEYYGSSVALKHKNEIVAGFVCNLATGNFIYKAFEYSLKEFNIIGKNVLKRGKIKKFGIFERAYKYPKISKKLHESNIKFRSLGAAAVSLAFSKNFDFVLFVGEIREFDIAASLYICNDQNIYKSKDFLLISKNKQKLELIKEIIKNNRL
ncbi:inositol monophosphatase family protein [Arcobacter sp. YIC-464]|uniref:inositol monophosphatase family protein n=1 Tax=Arcobacter sp. YIC-464 TaxID=3376631 RepID=UPI003C134F76